MTTNSSSDIKVIFPSEHMYKFIRIDTSLTVSQVREFIIEKRRRTAPISGKAGLDDYALFLPPTRDLPAQWPPSTEVLDKFLSTRVKKQVKPHFI